MDEEKKLEQSEVEGSQSTEEMKEHVIGERIVSEKVIGSSSGIARFGRKVKSQISSRLGGVLLGIILILVSLVVVWQSEKFDKASMIFKDLPLLSVEQAIGSNDLVKFQGEVTSVPIKSPLEDKDVWYYHHMREELEMVKETETETQVVTKDGQDIEQTIEKEVEKPKWVTKIDEEKWAPLTLGGKITVNPENARQILDLTGIYSAEGEKNREKVEAVLAGNQLLVVGEIKNNTIESGDPFIVSNLSNEKLLESLIAGEKSTWWLLKILTALLFGFGLYLILGPVLLILDAVPVLGGLGKGVIFAISIIIGILFTVFSSLIIHYWYVFLIIIIALIVYLIYRKKKTLVKKES